MRLDLLRQRLSARHHSEPQSRLRCDMAVRAIESELAALAGLGHVYHLEPGPPWLDEHDWPRTYFHLTTAPNGRVVNSRFDLADLGGEDWGWFPTLEAAQLAAGYDAQMHGRGGRPSRARELTIVKETDDDRLVRRSGRAGSQSTAAALARRLARGDPLPTR